jgi:hypothetical protein
MPWKAGDAERHTKQANTSALQSLWAKVANDELDRHGNDGRAIRAANAVVRREKMRRRKK